MTWSGNGPAPFQSASDSCETATPTIANFFPPQGGFAHGPHAVVLACSSGAVQALPRIIGAAGDTLKLQQHVHDCSNSAPTALLNCPVHALLPACAISYLKSPLCATRGPPFIMPNTIVCFDNNQVTNSKGLLRSLCTVKGKSC